MTHLAMSVVPAVLAAAGASVAAAERTGRFEKLQSVPFTEVKIADAFWAPRIETNRTRSIPHNFRWCRQTGRFSNFAKAAGLTEGGFEGIYFNDSDVYKVLEGTAYSLQAHPEAALEKEMEQVIAWIAAAQRPDGYLNTFYTLKEPKKRWTNCAAMHELYCAGHLFEAAVAHYRATGRKTLLNVATKFADHIAGIFGPDKRHDVPGHEEIELGLVKLAEATGRKEYFDLARFFLDLRGRKTPKRPKLYGRYCQDHEPLTDQSEPTGHAVRAMYLYSGMADVAAATGDKAYVAALERLWKSTVEGKMYITGAVGSTRHGEAFGKDYELPNATAYCETCASIGMCLWNHRMNRLHGDARYADTFERTLYNGLLAGVDLSGQRFFYVNPLASRGRHHRQPFYGCACCPTNVVRFLPSVPGYVYARGADGVYVNLYAAGEGKVAVGGQAVRLVQQTRYPWDGRVEIRVEPARPATFTVALRIPAWCVAVARESDLYQPADVPAEQRQVTLSVNGQGEGVKIVKGYACIRRRWTRGDRVELVLPMPIRRVRAHPKVAADAGRVALQRGPIVFCVEGVDNGPNVESLYLPRDAKLTAAFRKDLLGGVVVIRGKAKLRHRPPAADETVEIQAIPYYAWDHRRPGPMAVWIAEDRAKARPAPEPTAASKATVSASHVWHADTTAALNDQIEPANSNDHAVPRFTWWGHRGTSEWVQYSFGAPQRLRGAAVYWFDDRPGGGHCRVPGSWRLTYQAGGTWKPAAAAGPFGTKRDKYNEVTFEPVTTGAIRIEAQLQAGFSAGILEWRLTPAGK